PWSTTASCCSSSPPTPPPATKQPTPPSPPPAPAPSTTARTDPAFCRRAFRPDSFPGQGNDSVLESDWQKLRTEARVTEEDLTGRPWTREEVEATVADYLHMLRLTLLGQRVN